MKTKIRVFKELFFFITESIVRGFGIAMIWKWTMVPAFNAPTIESFQAFTIGLIISTIVELKKGEMLKNGKSI